MAFPPATLETNVSDATDQAVEHPSLHNRTSAAVNDLVAEAQRLNGALVAGDNALDARLDAVEGAAISLDGRLDIIEPAVNDLRADAAPTGLIRGRNVSDPIQDGGSVTFTQDLGTVGAMTWLEDGSAFGGPTGVYGVSVVTVADGGADLICYIDVGGRSVAVGSRIANGAATFATWVGRLNAGERVIIRASMPVPRAITSGRLEIWKLAESA